MGYRDDLHTGTDGTLALVDIKERDPRNSMAGLFQQLFQMKSNRDGKDWTDMTFFVDQVQTKAQSHFPPPNNNTCFECPWRQLSDRAGCCSRVDFKGKKSTPPCSLKYWDTLSLLRERAKSRVRPQIQGKGEELGPGQNWESEHSLTIEKGPQRQIWLPREDRLCPHTNRTLSCTP